MSLDFMRGTITTITIGVLVMANVAATEQRNEAIESAAHYSRLADDLDHAAMMLGEPWDIMRGVGQIAADMSDGTAIGWVSWLDNIDPGTSCIDGPGYVVCVAVKDTCWDVTP